MQAWRDPANIKRWVTTGRRLAEAVVFMPDMQTVLHEVAHVSPAVLGMMNDLAIIKMPVGTREARGRAERGRQGAR